MVKGFVRRFADPQRLTTLGFERGVRGGDRMWFWIGTAAVAYRLLRRLNAPDDPVILRRALEPGETLVIRHLAPEAVPVDQR